MIKISCTIFRSGRILAEYYGVLSYHVSDLLSRIALRLLKIIEPYLVEQERMANAELLMYGSKHLEQNFFFLFFLNMKVILGSLSTQ
jgi:hypothetical protein